MKHDDQCEMPKNPDRPTCHCATRAFLATASPEEVEAWQHRTGYDNNRESQWDLPPRRVL